MLLETVVPPVFEKESLLTSTYVAIFKAPPFGGALFIPEYITSIRGGNFGSDTWLGRHPEVTPDASLV